jgi:hypothetical protein
MEQPDHNIVTDLQTPEPVAQAQPEAPPAPQPAVPSVAGDLVFDVEKVSCYYGAFRAVTDVSLAIHENEDAEPHERPRARRPRRG